MIAMINRFLTPSEIAEATIATGIKKANLPPIKILLLGILAGMFISFGAHGYITIMQTFKSIDIGLMKFLGAAIFPVGLMLVVIAGGELFTGNNLMTLALANGKITMKKMLLNWFLVFAGNFIGSLFLAWIMAKAGLYNTGTHSTELTIGIVTSKLGLSFGEAFLRAILANILVVLAVWMAYASNDITSKILAIWFPVMLFVLSGFEHSIANMFYFGLGKFIGLDISWAQAWMVNLIPVTLGNIVGGAIVVPAVYYVVYVMQGNVKEKNSVPNVITSNREEKKAYKAS